MAVAQVFNVLTEFKFEVGSALVGTRQLQGAVDELSTSADQALIGFQKLGMGIVANLGLGPGGLLTFLYKSIQSSDKFTQSQIALANTIDSSFVPFDKRMQMANEALQEINRTASKFGLPTESLIQMTKILGPLLRSKGLAGANFGGAIDLGRSLLKSAPVLGIDPDLVQGQLMRMIEGQASTGDTLFNRLTGDTQTMKPFLGDSKKFNVLPEVQRFNLLRSALREFSSDAKVNAANVNTLRGQWQLLNDALSGTFSTFRSIGDMLIQPVLRALRFANEYLRGEGQAIANSLAKMIQPFTENPGRLIATLFQLKELKKDMNMAGMIVGLIGAFTGLRHILGLLGVQIPALTALIRPLLMLFGVGFAGVAAGFALFLKFLPGIVVLLSEIIGPIILLAGVFQLISRALAYAKFFAAERFFAQLPRFTDTMAILVRIWDVFNEGFDFFAQALGRFLDPTMLFGFIDTVSLAATIFENATMYLGSFLATFQGIIFVILEFFTQISSLFSGGGFDMAALGDAFGAGRDAMIERILGKIDSGEGVANMTTNIGKVEIQNSFKEQVEPDRIAFTIKEQIMKAAVNPTGSTNRNMRAGLVGQ